MNGNRLTALGVCVAALLLCAAPLRAERGAGGSLDMSLRGGSQNDLGDDDERVYATNALVELRGFYGVRFAFAAEFGFEIGAEAPAGFPYAVRLAPLGGAIRVGRRGWFGVTAGLGTSGVIDRVPIGLEFPMTAFAAFDLGEWIRVTGRARGAWVPTTDRRKGGSQSLDVFDELDIEAGIAIGKRESKFRSVFSDGTWVGVFVREQLGERFVGFSIALAMSGAGGF